MSDGAVASDWLISAFGLILTIVHHGRLVRLTVGVVSDVVSFMVARTIDLCPGEFLYPHILVSYCRQTMHQSVDTRDLS